MTSADWNTTQYTAYRSLRLQPALDLLARVPSLPQGDVIDLGCGTGVAAADLQTRFPGRKLIGVEQSETMIGKAIQTGLYHRLDQADIALWSPHDRPALIFSNAVLHWLPDHSALFARLVQMLAPRGVLAVQMPRQFMAPSHHLLRDLAQQMFPDRFNFDYWSPPVATPDIYMSMLSELGATQIWETEYYQRLVPVTAGHPVRHFTQSTAMRPILAKLSDAETAQFISHYDAALIAQYPRQSDGGVVFPFRRLFMVVAS